MSTATLVPPATEPALSASANALAAQVEDRLGESVASAPNRDAFFTMLRGAVRTLAASPAWRDHHHTTELLLLLEQLRDQIDADSSGTDPEWRVREVLQRMVVVLRTMVRKLDHDELDRPPEAARFVAESLAEVEKGEVARLLGTSTKMVDAYRRGEVGSIRRHRDRVVLVAQLVYELQGSMTPRGILLWFDAPVAQLGDRSPRALLDDAPAHRAALTAFARGGRGQLDRGGVTHAALDRAA